MNYFPYTYEEITCTGGFHVKPLLKPSPWTGQEVKNGLRREETSNGATEER